MITKEQIEEWRKLKDEGMVSGVGEYTPPEFWWALDCIETLKAENKQIKREKALLFQQYKDFVDNSMSIERVQKMALQLAKKLENQSIYDCEVWTKSDVDAFIEEWRKNNDC